MTRTAADYSNVRSGKQLYRLDDMGELAARMGSVSTYDRKGNVFFLTDFSRGMTSWLDAAYGTGAEIRLTTNYPFRDPYAVLIMAGSDGAHGGVIANYMNPLELGKWGLEVGVAFFTDFDQFRVEIIRHDGTNRHTAKIVVHKTDGKLMYEKVGGGYVEIDELPDLVGSYGIYHHLKVVADFESDEFIRVSLNQDKYPLTDIAMPTYADTSLPHILLRFHFIGRAGENDWCQVGYAIATQDES